MSKKEQIKIGKINTRSKNAFAKIEERTFESEYQCSQRKLRKLMITYRKLIKTLMANSKQLSKKNLMKTLKNKLSAINLYSFYPLKYEY